MDDLRRAFKLFDDDNTGKISLRNLRRVAKEIGDRLEDDELYVAYLADFALFTRLQASHDRRIRSRPGRRNQRARVLRYYAGRCMITFTFTQ